MSKRAPRKPNVRRVVVVLDPRNPGDPRELLEHLIAIAKIEEIHIQLPADAASPPTITRHNEQLEAHVNERLEKSLEQQDMNLRQMKPIPTSAAAGDSSQPTDDKDSVGMKQLKQNWCSLGVNAFLKIVELITG